MPTDFKPGCARPKSTLVKPEESNDTILNEVKEVKSMIKVGAPAPDFELAGYFQGGFKNFKLSEFKGKWVVLCFYPGDFTFV
ncbi:peroxiredoxin (alkyl hydroperoxide reductase subunit C) [Fusibacter tunisiensis]|jgi:peroxiredoxin (alkyl hydroperoxide reductase subunit C)|nr:peroxiredoxin (alkyl hydroperoxide reductase subunit C) [Fusibacter tunisiensis]